MRLAPRQLQRAGMTGAVPYYGGRLTPAHISALQHQPPAEPPGPPPGRTPEQQLALLAELRADGVLTDDEFEALRTRVAP